MTLSKPHKKFQQKTKKTNYDRANKTELSNDWKGNLYPAAELFFTDQQLEDLGKK